MATSSNLRGLLSTPVMVTIRAKTSHMEPWMRSVSCQRAHSAPYDKSGARQRSFARPSAAVKRAGTVANGGLLTIARGTPPLSPVRAGRSMPRTAFSLHRAHSSGRRPFGLILDQHGPRAALLLSGSLTGLSFLALMTLRPSAHKPD